MPDGAWTPKTKVLEDDLEEERRRLWEQQQAVTEQLLHPGREFWRMMGPEFETPAPEFKPELGFMRGVYPRVERTFAQWGVPGAMFGVAPQAGAARAGLAEAAAKGGLERIIPWAVRAGLKPVEMLEQAPGKVLGAIGRRIRGRITPPKLKPAVREIPKGEPGIPKAVETIAEPVTKPPEAVDKLIRVIKGEKPSLRQTEKLRHAEMKKRVAMIRETLGKEGEPEELLAEAAKLRAGKMPIAEHPIKEQFTKEEANNLYRMILDSPLRALEKLRARDAFNKLVLTDEPLQRNEIELLSEIFGSKFMRALETGGQKAMRHALSAANLPRAVLASTDLSATLRQGGILIARRSYLLPGMIKQELKSFWGEKSAQLIDDAVRSHPRFAQFEELGGYIAPLGGKLARLTQREEQFMTEWAHYIPLVRRSERAFINGLNWLRIHSFEHGAKLFEKAGYGDDESLRGLVNLITKASGRGSLKFLGQGNVGPIANAVFFSPRLILSRLQLPALLFNSNPMVRKEAWRMAIQFLGIGTGILSMAKLLGAGVETDSRSPDVGKITIGNTSIDIWTGYVQYARFLAQFITGSRKMTSGTRAGKITEANRLELLTRLVQSKFAPLPGLLWDLMAGRTYIGEEMTPELETVKREFFRRITPLTAQDIIDAVTTDDWGVGVLAGVTGGLGAGVVSYPRGRISQRELEEGTGRTRGKHPSWRDLIR